MSLRVSSTGISQARQGVSEERFMQYLQQYFEEVVQAAEFKIPSSGRSYSADFTVIHTPSGIGIDVEIDEPYAGKSKKPTHCCDADSDMRRNQLDISKKQTIVESPIYYNGNLCKKNESTSRTHRKTSLRNYSAIGSRL